MAEDVPTAPMVREQALVIDCDGEGLVGVLHHPPEQAAQATGVVVIVGGPQYRAGSHRQFVHLARVLAAAGHPVLRFDVRGMGDSTGELHSFEQVAPDIGAAIEALLRHAPQVRQVVLWGLCDGASAALLYLDDRHDARVRGLCLLNPWVRSEASLARTHVKHYYLQRLGQREFWAKLLRGGVGLDAVNGLLRNARRAAGRGSMQAVDRSERLPFQQRMARAWRDFPGPLLLLLSGRDLTACEFIETTAVQACWRGLLERKALQQHHLAAADHTFSDPASREQSVQHTLRWMSALSPPDTAMGATPAPKLEKRA